MEINNTDMKTAGHPALTFYHANLNGTGCALALTLHPAHDRTDGFIMARFANQMTVGNANGSNPTFPKFDWENEVKVMLDFTNLSRILQVFRGECESINEGKGLFHIDSQGNTVMNLRHVLEPCPGYVLEASYVRRNGNGESDKVAHIFLSSAEALGIMTAVEGSMATIAFGVPKFHAVFQIEE